ncbi:DUF192 domain-containing protein [Halovenus salina]|uniref:DUF192 domain-containing protein n=1 Tax=Halovenus salina TaxID=1510225 RepID=A0ABD5VYU3_9EURY|nr:DUF192 domain-containing protein [Halovenus salina]
MRDRRELLTLLAGTAGLAGCLESSSDAETPAAETPADSPTETDASTPTTTDSDPTATQTDRATAEETPTDTETPTPESLFPGYETTEIAFATPEGEQLASITAALAETTEEWRLGLSDTESLPEDWGMLFVDDSVSDRRFWMKEMDFGLDMLFVDDEKTITSISHAPEPEGDGRDDTYNGRGQYVLEVNYRWTERNGVSEGDVLEFEL